MDGSYVMAIKVNGYYCDSNAQVALANRDINPAFPSWTPGQILPVPPPKPANPPAVVVAASLADAAGGQLGPDGGTVAATGLMQTARAPDAPVLPGARVDVAV